MVRLFNTLGKKKQTLRPLHDHTVSMYHCGPTLYWTQHIGNLRGMVLADLIVRSLQYLGYSLKLVRNYTDVGHLTSDTDAGEDKMALGARREQLDPTAIAKKYKDVFERDLALLNVLPATKSPMATAHIGAMQHMIERLIHQGYAYTTNLAIYFDVTKAKKYNKLSGQDITHQQIGAGKGDVGDPAKKNPQDFALWFFKKGVHARALQTWQFSPYGDGFPGWHIECSAMIQELLGDTIDIHMGGIEHIPVHHTNEIAQSEAANHKPLAKYWLHNEHLLVDGKKMSKSEGTGFSLSEVLEMGFEPMDLRYFFLQAHYRSKQNFTWKALASARAGRLHLVKQVAGLQRSKNTRLQEHVSKVWDKKFAKAISDDFNIPQGLAIVSDMLKAQKISEVDKLTTVLAWDQVLGLQLHESVTHTTDIPSDVQELVRERDQARARKDWRLSDTIRDQISAQGYAVEDTPEGTRVTKN